MKPLTPNNRMLLMDMMSTCINKTIEQIMHLRFENPSHTVIDTGYYVDTKLTIPAEGIFQIQLKQAAKAHNLDLESMVRVVTDEHFKEDFNSDDRPVMVVNVIDGKLALCNYLAEVTRREQEFGLAGSHLLQFMPTSTVSAALFEGCRYDDITMGIVGLVSNNPKKDIISANLEDGRYIGYINNNRINASMSRLDIPNSQSRILVLASTNYYNEGIGKVKDLLTSTKQFLEIRSECTGSSIGDIFLLINNQYHAMVDIRAAYSRSWATLKLRNAAPLIPIVKAFNWELSSVSGKSLDEELKDDWLCNGHYINNPGILDNRELTLLVARTPKLREALILSLGDSLPETREKWKRHKDFAAGPRHPMYTVIEPMKSTPFKVSYLGREKETGVVKFIHVLIRNKAGMEYCRKHGVSDSEYINKECSIMNKISLNSNHILMPTDISLLGGHVMIVEPPCEAQLISEYPPTRLTEYLRFMQHAPQMLKALIDAHSLPEPLIHGDIHLGQFGIYNNRVVLDDWGVTSQLINTQFQNYLSKTVCSVMTRSPEEFDSPGTKTIQNDLYSLGCVFSRMLTGHYPVHDPTIPKPLLTDGQVRKAYEREVKNFKKNKYFMQKMKSRYTGIPSELTDFVLKFLHIDPAKRYRTAFEAHERLIEIKDALYQAYMRRK